MPISLSDPAIAHSLQHDKALLEATEIPIITVSATWKEDLKRLHGFPDDDTTPDVVYSRAHYSMAVGIAAQAWGSEIDPAKAWLADPTNYVSYKDWRSIKLTEDIGKTIARHPILKRLKDLIDTFGRSKLPILDSITPPLMYLTRDIEKPILSFHIAAGNILAAAGKSVVQVITDPHVRPEYVDHAHLPTMRYCVFDENTKTEALEQAALADKELDPDRVIVTGPPVDPRIVAARKNKRAWRSGPLKLCLTTGGLGTNKDEIKEILEQVLPELRRREPMLQLLVYCATHEDIYEMVRTMAKRNRVALSPLEDQSAKLRVLYHPQILDANEELIRWGFPWAHGFVSKPSGDMAYDAAASGSFLLTLREWGPWEFNIREVFEQRGIGRQAQTEAFLKQLVVLTEAGTRGQSWVERAMHAARGIDPLFLGGAEGIVQAYLRVETAD